MTSASTRMAPNDAATAHAGCVAIRSQVVGASLKSSMNGTLPHHPTPSPPRSCRASRMQQPQTRPSTAPGTTGHSRTDDVVRDRAAPWPGWHGGVPWNEHHSQERTSAGRCRADRYCRTTSARAVSVSMATRYATRGRSSGEQRERRERNRQHDGMIRDERPAMDPAPIGEDAASRCSSRGRGAGGNRYPWHAGKERQANRGCERGPGPLAITGEPRERRPP